MVTDLIWAPDFFGLQEIWSLRNFGPKKFGHFYEGTKFLGDQVSQGPNFLGPKLLGDQISWGPKKSGAQMRTGTISVIASF